MLYIRETEGHLMKQFGEHAVMNSEYKVTTLLPQQCLINDTIETPQKKAITAWIKLN